MALINVTPVMTADNAPSPYVASASTSTGVGTEAFRAFDGVLNASGTEWIATTTTGWLKLDFGSRMWAVSGFIIQPEDPARAPKDFTIEGSNDDSSWDVLATYTGQTSWTTHVAVTYTLATPNLKKYRYYRINVSANNGSGTNLEIEEFRWLALRQGGGVQVVN